MLIYLGAPIDQSAGDESGRETFKRAVTARGCAVYDATLAFAARPEAISPHTARQVAAVHHGVIDQSDVAVFDLSSKSIGTPIEMWQAYALPGDPRRYTRKVFAYLPEGVMSLYASATADGIYHSWQEIAGQCISLLSREPQ